MRPRNARPSTRGPQSAYRPAERAEGGLCALRAAPNPMSEREHELHRRMTSLTERHRAWPRSWARTERAVPRDPFAGGVGSSPHTRGARPWKMRPRRTVRDHPRIRGEHAADGADVAVEGGIIPAYAGNTGSPLRPRSFGRGTIPAYAGNTSRSLMRVSGGWGSSPHTRGTLGAVGHVHLGRGDHPRIRGEHVLVQQQRNALVGIIPACAGNTKAVYSPVLVRSGSSPHTRGTPSSRRK